jgi:GNAT superfamily N-acetyltransferase
MQDSFTIRFASENDVALILEFIKELAVHLNLTHEKMASEEELRQNLFGKNPRAEVIIGYDDCEPVAFALFYHNFSTPMGRPGLYLEDLYVKPKMRGKGFGKKLLVFLARLAIERKCARFEWMALKKDQPTINFYKKTIGAKAMDEWTVFRLTEKALKDVCLGVKS